MYYLKMIAKLHKGIKFDKYTKKMTVKMVHFYLKNKIAF